MNLWLVRQVHQTHTVTVLESTTHAPTRAALRADWKGGSLLPRLIPRYLHLTQHLPRSVQFVGASTPCPGSRKIMDSCTQVHSRWHPACDLYSGSGYHIFTSKMAGRWHSSAEGDSANAPNTFVSIAKYLPYLAPYEFFSIPCSNSCQPLGYVWAN